MKSTHHVAYAMDPADKQKSVVGGGRLDGHLEEHRSASRQTLDNHEQSPLPNVHTQGEDLDDLISSRVLPFGLGYVPSIWKASVKSRSHLLPT